MGHISMTMSGSLGDAIRRVEALGEMDARAGPALEAGAQIALEAMREKVPVKAKNPGEHIRDKLTYKFVLGGKSVEVGVWDPVPYYVNYGHGGPHPAPAHPFIDTIMDGCEDAVMAEIERKLLEGL